MSIALGKLKVEGYSNILGILKVSFKNKGARILKAHNGEGKTTILSSIAWVLYGKPLKIGSTIEPWEHKRDANYVGTKVSLTFIKNSITYKVTRCKDYTEQVYGAIGKNRLILHKGSEEITDYKNKKDLQNILEEIIGYNYDLFINTTIFPQKITRFIELKGAQRKEILEEVFDISTLKQGYRVAKDKYTEYSEEATNNETEAHKHVEAVITEESAVRLLRAQAEKQTAMLIEVQARLSEHLSKGLQKITIFDTGTLRAAQIKYNALKGSEEYLDYQENLQALSSNKALLSSERKEENNILKQIKSIKYDKPQKCPVCSSQHTAKSRARAEKFHTTSLEKIVSRLSKRQSQINKLEKEVQQGAELTTKANTLKEIIRSEQSKQRLHKQSSLNNEALNKLHNQTTKEIEGDLASWESMDNSQDIQRLEQSILDHTHKGKIYARKAHSNRVDARVAKFVADRVFGKNGFSAYLLDSAISGINELLKQYEEHTGYGVELCIADNAYKDVQAIVYIDKYPVIYQDLSGGQAQMVNASISLAFAEFMSNKGSISFLGLDEIFENLDTNNAAKVAGIVSQLSLNKEVWLISHRVDIVIPNAEVIHIGNEDKVIRTLTI